jgi:hypothetical protein
VLISTAVVLAAAPRIRSIRHHLRDERAPIGPIRETMRRVLVRYPIGTALFEEVAFRGVLPPLLANRENSGDLASAVAFGIWHLVPTHHALVVNGIGRDKRSRLLGTLAGSAAAGVAGYVLSRIRRKTGSLLAPWLIHGAINTTSYLAVVLARPESIDSSLNLGHEERGKHADDSDDGEGT